MSRNTKDVPSVADKLAAPNKKSIFERQKAEAEAKRLKEQEETAAVYADFVKSFDHEDDGDDGFSRGAGRSAPVPHGAFGKRHFTNNLGSSVKVSPGVSRASGPGSLGPAPSSLPRKRTHDGYNISSSKASALGFEDDPPLPADTKRTFQDLDDEEDIKDVKSKDVERIAARPTLHLSNLPPALASSAIKRILPSNLKVDSVRMLPFSGSTGTDRKVASAIVTFAADTPAGDIDSAVSALQRKYLGWGHFLSLSRHLSSAAIGSGILASGGSGSASGPFGAKQVPQGPAQSFSRAPPPPGMGRAYAPPASYGVSSAALGRNGPPLRVEVKPPTDLRQLKLIHKMVENVITHGPEFEALLMSRPSVQQDEKWAWLWDARSQGGVWYRWRLWDIVTDATRRMKRGRGSNDDAAQYLFEGGAIWQSEERALAFEYDTNIADFVSESEYDSSEDEDSGDEGRQRLQRLQGSSIIQDQGTAGEADVPSYLNPLQKAKLVHLLARLPYTTAKLRRGDVARITAFAIRNASEGSEEVVDLITGNIHLPFSLSSANPEWRAARDDSSNEGGDSDDADKEKESYDISSIKLIALYVVSDILSASSTSGARHAWRYRQLFEASLRKRATFAHLGRLEREQGWGRLRAEKFKRSVNGVLNLWEGWCAFSAESQEEFAKTFNEPPLTEREQQEEAERREKEAAEEAERRRSKVRGKWKTVEEGESKSGSVREGEGEEGGDVDVDGEPMDEGGPDNNNEREGERREEEEEEDLDGEPMDEEDEDEDLDGEPMAEDTDSGDGGDGNDGNGRPDADENSKAPGQGKAASASAGRIRRPRAEDMFADDSGGE